MTILSCQKRHHEPHLVADHPDWEWCDGLPQWPYARPKPPHLHDWPAYGQYQYNFNTASIGWCGGTWLLEWDDPDRGTFHSLTFPKTEWSKAIQHAQNLVNERKKNSGTW